MRKILFIILIPMFICGCSKNSKNQETSLLVTPSVTVKEDIKQTPIPSNVPSPTTTIQSVGDVDANKANPENTESFDIADNKKTSKSDSESYMKEVKTIRELLYEADNKFIGVIGEAKIHMRLSYQNNKITGVYSYDKYKQDIRVDGLINFDLKGYSAINLKEDTEQYGEFIGIISTKDCIKGYWKDYDHIYPMLLMREGSNAEEPQKPDSNTCSYEGHWYGINASYFSGSELDIKALFRDMIYFDLEANNGANTGSHSGVAFVDQNSAAIQIADYYDKNASDDDILIEFTKQNEDLYLKSSDYSYECGYGVSFDNQYSKINRSADEPTAIDTGIVSTPEQDEDFRRLTRTYYSSFIHYTQDVAYEEIILDGEKAKAGKSLLRGLDGYCYYIVSEYSIYAAFIDENDIKYFTNDWYSKDQMPQPMQEWADEFELPISYYNDCEALPFDKELPDILKGQIELIKSGQKITLPKGYSLLEYTEGDINMDDQKDIAVVIQQNPGYATGSRCIYLFIQNNGNYSLKYVNSKIALCSGEGGIWGDPYDGISITDGELNVCDYGGSADRWSHDYVFKIWKEKLCLISINTYDINVITGDSTTCRYDLLKGILETKSCNEFEEDSNEPTDFTYSGSFILDHEISFEEAEAWMENKFKINP